MSDKAENGLSGVFNDEAIWKATKALFWVGVGFFVGGVIDYTFFHNHPLGQAIIKIFESGLMDIFDTLATAVGFDDYTYSGLYDSITTDVATPDGNTVKEVMGPEDFMPE